MLCGSAGKESACNEDDLGLIPGLGRSLGEGKGYPLQYSGLENSMDCIVHGVTKSQTQLSDFHFHFAPWKKSYDQPDSILKSRDITLSTKVCLVEAMVFPVVTYGCESWDYKESWAPKNWCFLTIWCWRKLLRIPWTARRSNQSILKEIRPEHSLDGVMLKLQYFGHLMTRTDSFEKTLMLGKIEGGRRRGRQRMRWLDGITISMDISLSKL